LAFTWRSLVQQTLFVRRVCLAAAIGAIGASLPAQVAQQPTAPGVGVIRRFDTGFVAGGEWLQATAMPLDREALHSMAFDLSWRQTSWQLTGGWLRIARDLSSVQGATLGAGALLHWKQILFIPSLSLFGGESYASRDTTGYDFVGTGGVIGHVPRYDYSSAFSMGGGVGLNIEFPIYRMVAGRVSASHWLFSGHPLENDRQRTNVGAGLSIRVRP
jgi:hypothetical protein